jgi:integrase
LGDLGPKSNCFYVISEEPLMGKAKTLTTQELRRVQDYIATRAHAARNRAMLLLTHLAGMRVGEVATLTWGDVVNTKGRVKDEIRMNADQTKGGHPRIVFLSQHPLFTLFVKVSTSARNFQETTLLVFGISAYCLA